MGTRIKIVGARASYPHLVNPRAVQAGDTPKYGCAFILQKGNPAIAEILQADAAEKGARWGANVPPTAKSVPMYDGDMDPKYNTIPDNHGAMILNCSSKDAVPIIDTTGSTPMDPASIYAGCYVNAFVDVYSYDAGMSKGCAFGLVAIQFVQNGDRLDGRPDATTLFDAIEGAPAPIAPGIQPAAPQAAPVAPAPVQPAANPYAQPAPVTPAYQAPPVGVPVAPAPVAPQPAGVPPVGVPSFLG